MKPQTKKRISILIVATLALPVVGNARFAYGKAKAESGFDESGTSLLLPTAYEQYLPLTSPTDVAVTEEYIAVADGTEVYVYDRETGVYSTYGHTVNVNELQFSASDLYLLDQSMNLFKVSAESLPSEPLNGTDAIQHCISFTIDADTIYLTKKANNRAQIVSAPLSDPTKDTLLGQEFSAVTDPALAVYGGELYYTTTNDINSFLYRMEENRPVSTFNCGAIGSLAFLGDNICYTSAGNFYVYAFSSLLSEEDRLIFQAEGTYTAVSASDDGSVYVVDGSSIKQFSMEKGGFTDYEITSSSDSINRLSGATDVVLCGNELIISDSGNERIGVVNVLTKKTRVVKTDETAEKIASDGKTAMTVNGNKIFLYDLADGTLLCKKDVGAPVVGVTSVYGTYYFITANGFYTLSETEYGYNVNGTACSMTPTMLASDVFGTLYVAFTDKSVYAYGEELFTLDSQRKNKVATLPDGTTKMCVSFDRTVYALSNGKAVNCATDETYSIPKTVFGQSDATETTSFTFGVERKTAYFLYDGNFLTATDELSLPTLKEIAVNGADEPLFKETDTNFSVVSFPEKTLMIRFDVSTLSKAEYFPYLSYGRSDEARTAIKLGESGEYALVAVFERATGKYETSLVQKTSCTEISADVYLKEAIGFEGGKAGYVSNALPLYKYPYLTDLLTVCNLEKHTKVSVLNEIDELDYAYYYVSYTDETGTTHYGYLPCSYVADFDGRPPQSTNVVLGNTEANSDVVWRLVFIMLGFGAICVLTDFLILRKKQK